MIIIKTDNDHYLEISTLYIIRKYDPREYYKRINNLKFICLERHLDCANMFSPVFEEEFIDELVSLCRDILKKAKEIDKNDPRHHKDIRSKFFRF